MWCKIASVSVIFSLLSQAWGSHTAPEQIAVAATELYSQLVITWVTFDPTDSSEVFYAVHNGKDQPEWSYGTMTKFVNPDGSIHITRYIHRVMITGLAPQLEYDYQCGSPSNWSKVLTLRTLGDENSSPVFAVYGDMGTTNAMSLPFLIDDVNSRKIDGVLHVGDMAYNLNEDNGRYGDKFMNQIQPIASKVPYMVAPGNHEYHSNFTHYKQRYSMPGNTESLYYSWDIGPAHIISISTEVYYYIWDGIHNPAYQYQWLEEDLKRANHPEQRAKHPWIIVMGHRPMYCTTIDPTCNNRESIVRIGNLLTHEYGLEKLFYDYGVDIMFWAHEHIYERFWPLYNFKIMNGSYDQPYVNPPAPVHIITGSAGCRERHSFFGRVQPPWMAFKSSDYGYTRMAILNATHISMEQISVDKDGDIIDDFVIVKHEHKSYQN